MKLIAKENTVQLLTVELKGETWKVEQLFKKTQELNEVFLTEPQVEEMYEIFSEVKNNEKDPVNQRTIIDDERSWVISSNRFGAVSLRIFNSRVINILQKNGNIVEDLKLNQVLFERLVLSIFYGKEF